MTNQQNAGNLVQLYKNEVSGLEGSAKTFNDMQIALIKSKHPKINDLQLLEFLIKCSVTGANPTMGDVYLVEMKGRMTTTFSYHWMIKKANELPDYDGFTLEFVVKKVPKVNNGKVNLVDEYCAIVTVGRKGRKDTIYEAPISEYYNANSPMWKTKTRIMLQKCAVAGALRWAFPEIFERTYLNEEMKLKTPPKPMDLSGDGKNDVEVKVEVQKETPEETAKKDAIRQIVDALKLICEGHTPEQKKDVLKRVYGKDSFNDVVRLDIGTLRKSFLVLKEMVLERTKKNCQKVVEKTAKEADTVLGNEQVDSTPEEQHGREQTEEEKFFSSARKTVEKSNELDISSEANSSFELDEEAIEREMAIQAEMDRQNNEAQQSFDKHGGRAGGFERGNPDNFDEF